MGPPTRAATPHPRERFQLRTPSALSTTSRGASRSPAHPRSAAPKKLVAAQNHTRGSPYHPAPRDATRVSTRAGDGRPAVDGHGGGADDVGPDRSLETRRRAHREPVPAKADVSGDLAG